MNPLKLGEAQRDAHPPALSIESLTMYRELEGSRVESQDASGQDGAGRLATGPIIFIIIHQRDDK